MGNGSGERDERFGTLRYGLRYKTWRKEETDMGGRRKIKMKRHARFNKWKVVSCDYHPNIMYKDLHNGKYESFQLHRLKKRKWWHSIVFWKRFRVDNPKDYIELPDNPNPKARGKGYVYKKIKRRPKSKYFESQIYSKWKASNASKLILDMRYAQRRENRLEQDRTKKMKKRGPGSTASR